MRPVRVQQQYTTPSDLQHDACKNCSDLACFDDRTFQHMTTK